MRHVPKLLMAATLTLSGAAGAKCPVRWDNVPTAWGAPTATEDEERIYEPRNLRMLGKAVTYVAVMHESRRTKVYYRLAGEIRHLGQALSPTLLAEFGRAYPVHSCTALGGSCSADLPPAVRAGELMKVEVEGMDSPGTDWNGPGARHIAADERMRERTGGSSPAHLVCTYERP